MARLKLPLSLCAGLLALATASPSFAADLPQPVYKAPIYVAPVFTWTGFYAGINGGYGWSDSFADDAKGAVYGGQLGYNWQTGNFVFGLEGDFQGTTIKASETIGAATAEGKIKAFATVRGRLGYAVDRLLIYGTGGWAYTNTELSLTVGGASISDSSWGSGYAIGGGLEWAVWDRWSVKGEYLYIHSGDTTLTLAGVTATGDFKYNVIRAGLNYRF
jgi:outer membrane immunogenic protein